MARYAVSTVLQFLYYSPNCTSVTPTMRTRYVWMVRMSTSVLTHLLIVGLPHVVPPAQISCVISGRKQQCGGKRWRKCDLEPVTSHVAYKVVTQLLQAHSTGR